MAKGEKVPANIKWQGVIFQYEENNYRAGGIYLIEWVNKTLSNFFISFISSKKLITISCSSKP